MVSPGVTYTEFLAVAGQQPSLCQRTMRMESPEATRIAIDALLSGKASVAPGCMNARLATSTRRLPRQLAVQAAADQPASYLLRCPVSGSRRPERQPQESHQPVTVMGQAADEDFTLWAADAPAVQLAVLAHSDTCVSEGDIALWSARAVFSILTFFYARSRLRGNAGRILEFWKQFHDAIDD